MQRPAPAESCAEAVGDTGSDTKLASVSWSSTGSVRGTQAMSARRERVLQSLRLITC